MQRSYLKLGDKSSAGGTVIEGIPFFTDNGKEVTFVGATVVCPACKASGPIVARGPRWPGEIFGKRAALEGDVCACKCSPPPVMLASDLLGMTMAFESDELTSLGFDSSGKPLDISSGQHWIRFVFNENGNCEGLRCRAHFFDGSIEEGVVDSENKVHFERSNALACRQVEVLLDTPQELGESVTGNLLRAMGW